jgi:hypothetical protein
MPCGAACDVLKKTGRMYLPLLLQRAAGYRLTRKEKELSDNPSAQKAALIIAFVI